VRDCKVGSRILSSNNAKLVCALVSEDEEERRKTCELLKRVVRG
jgi:hypothetical protein